MTFERDSYDIAMKFASVLGAVENITKTQTADTGKYTYSYADLGDVLDECKRVCQAFGLAVFQVPSYEGDKMIVTTMLIDQANGETITFAPMALMLPREAQAFGSALTYARRYSLLTIFGIAPEDDDGAAATTAAQTQPGRRTEAERMIRESIGRMDATTQRDFQAAFKAQFGSGLSDLPAARHGDALTWSRQWEQDRSQAQAEADADKSEEVPG